MHVFLLALGTRGDIELFVTLGRELLRRGHRVVLGTSGFYADSIRGAGLEFQHIGSGTRSGLLAVLQALSAVSDKTRRTRLYYEHWLRPQLAAFRAQSAAMVGQADYFISGLKIVLQRGDKIMPGASVTYDPPLDRKDLTKYPSHDCNGRILELVAMTRLLVDPEQVWGEQFRFTGFWRAEASAPPPADELVAFVRDGTPPVVITLGSMVMFDSAKLVRDISEALVRAGQRGVLVGGWSAWAPTEASAALYWVKEVDYDWLFPEAACVIHHGGCGTLAAVLRAGKPSILLPQITCQELIGRMLARQHLLAGMFDVQTLKPADLAGALERAVADEHLQNSARRWRTMALEEQGVRTAADLIEAHRAGLAGDSGP